MGPDGRVSTWRWNQLRARNALPLACVVLGLSSGCRGAQPAAEATPGPSKVAHEAAHDAGVLLARFGDRVITRRQLEQGLAGQPKALQEEYKAPGARQALLERMVRLELLADEARHRGLDRQPEVQRKLDELLVEELMNQLFGEKALEATPLTDVEVQRYYEAHAAEFHTPEERRASEIIVGDVRAAQLLLQRVAARPGDDAHYRRVTEQLAKDPAFQGAQTRELGYFSRGTLGEPPPAVRDVAFGLSRVGEIAPQSVAVDGKFHIVRLTGIRPPVDRSLADVQNLIRSRLRQEQRTQGIERLVAELKHKTQLQTYPERLADPAASAPSSASPSE